MADSAHGRGLLSAESRLLSLKASAQTASFQFRQAAQTYLRARRVAEQAADWPVAALISFNLSNVYYHLGALTEASAAAARSDQLTSLGSGAGYRVGLALHKARLAWRIYGPSAASLPLRRALQLAESSGAPKEIALIQETMAVRHLEAGELEQAAQAATAARQLRTQQRDPLLSSTLLTLSRIRLVQGRARDSLELAQQAMDELSRHSPQRPLFRFYQFRGEAKAALGDLESARADLRAAVEHLRLLRPEVLPAEAIRLRAAASNQEVFASLAEVCNELYFRFHRRADLEEGFAAANENRAWAMRSSLGRHEDPAPEYASALLALREAELQALRERSPQTIGALASARLRVAEIEMASSDAPRAVVSPLDLNRIQSKLPPQSAVIQFQTGARRSYAWLLTPHRLELARIPPMPRLQQSVQRFRQMIEQDSPAATQAGHEVYEALFGGLGRSAGGATNWTILPDQFLYQVPFPALVSRLEGGRPRYLIEDVAVQLAPFLSSAPPPVASVQPGFAGFGDPIYNAADTRWRAPSSGVSWFRWASVRPIEDGALLPRLPGTALEIRSAAKAWNGRARLFTGSQASIAGLRAALAGGPEVLHLATHLVPGGADPSESRLLLSLSPAGLPELLDPVAVSHLPATCALVVMSGCRAGAADAIASEGLLGLSRAWLVAGAASVLATQWPMPDDSGETWDAFYRAWRTSEVPPGASRASLALQHAQREMIASDSWRARPRFWASYFVIGSR